MKEYKQEAGVRRWHGDEFVALQKEALDAIQGLVAPYGTCILQGCTITAGTGSSKNISAGLVSLLHPTDGRKIVRFAGVSNVVLDEGGIRIKKTTVNKLYADGNNHKAYDLYEADWGSVDGLSLGSYIMMDPAPATLASAMGVAMGAGWIETVHTLSSSSGTGSMTARRNPLLRLVHLTGSFTVSGGTNPPTWTAVLNMPSDISPVRDVFFPCMIRYHTISPVIPAGEAASIPYFTHINAAIQAQSGSTTLGIGIIRAAAGASYTVRFSVMYNLD